jgi:hypothetical protein
MFSETKSVTDNDFIKFDDDYENDSINKNENVELENPNNIEVINMMNIKRIFDCNSDQKYSNEYDEIKEKVNQFLLKYCKHEKETDLFDITPDKSVTVCYCKICYCTFK